ncbi:MAG: HEAT repeat domain-containing protein [Lentisphaeria bacterium]|nr:HEAT repeat domain-containing protein [Lentisphaeria bacterium]
MGPRTTSLLLAIALLAATVTARAERVPVPLNDHTRLGQVFSPSQAFTVVSVTVPSWLDAEGGLTLTLWDSPQRTSQLAEEAFEAIPDNAPVRLHLPKPLPPGRYYWEVHRRTGRTRVGLYADVLDTPTENCAFFDGKPDPSKRFLFSTTPTPFRYSTVPEMIAALENERPLEQRTDACRQLALQGTVEAVPALAALLNDEALAHMARYALQPMPFPEVDDVLRESLGTLSGAGLVGVIQTIGARRDPAAVIPLAARLRDADAKVAAAAAAALGGIGTHAAAEVLLAAAPAAAPGPLRIAIEEGLLDCANRLLQAGDRERAVAIFAALRAGPALPALRAGAVRGAIVGRGDAGLSLLAECLSGNDETALDTALWLVQHELPGEATTRFLGRQLEALPEERRVRLIQALGNRGDDAALPALRAQASADNAALRQAVVAALTHFPPAAAAPLLARYLDDPDAMTAKTAWNALATMPGRAADDAVIETLRSPGPSTYLPAIRLAGARGLRQTRPDLLAAAAHTEAPLRIAALGVLADLALPEDIPALLQALARAPEESERAAAEKALAAACRRSDTPDACADTLTERLPGATPPLRDALLRVLGTAAGPRGRHALVTAFENGGPEVRAVASRTIAEWSDPDAVPDLLRLAASVAPESPERVLLLRPCIRTAGERSLDVPRRLDLCRRIVPLTVRGEERKLLLGALGALHTPEALDLVASCMDEPETSQEAAVALLAVAEALLPGAHAAATEPFLRRLAEHPPSPEVGAKAQALLERLRPPAQTGP